MVGVEKAGCGITMEKLFAPVPQMIKLPHSLALIIRCEGLFLVILKVLVNRISILHPIQSRTIGPKGRKPTRIQPQFWLQLIGVIASRCRGCGLNGRQIVRPDPEDVSAYSACVGQIFPA